MDQLRVAIISTPRSGNTWLKNVLAQALDLQQFGVHNPAEILSTLPERLALQIHWYREPNFQAFLRDKGFRIIVIARHPLDVLVSVLHFVRREQLSRRWLEGNAELPSDLGQSTPASPEFLAYAESWGAENLLSVSYLWWHDPDAIRVHYEDLVKRPLETFSSIATQLNQSAEGIRTAVEKNPITVLRNTPNIHGWQGTPGRWRRLIVRSDALRIQQRHERIFATLGYGVPLYFLTRRRALQNWRELAL